jgi:Holliday junction resolvase-like predicted endonuclease
MEGARRNPRKQGDAGEFSAMEWLASQGFALYLPFGHSPNVDLIAEDDDGSLLRVQVKTSTHWVQDRWSVMLCTRGGNQSWNGVSKYFTATRCDRLFVHVGDGRRWFIPASAVGGGSGILLGGPKYAAYEVSRGRPLPMPVAR